MTSMTKQGQSVLILSTGRTGTKFLADVLGETNPEANVYFEGGERSRLINILSNAHLAGILPESFLLAAWKQAIYQPLRKTQIQNSDEKKGEL